MTNFAKDQIVKYAEPQKGEADFRFIVLEDRETRVLAGLVDAPALGFPLGLTECLANRHFVVA